MKLSASHLLAIVLPTAPVNVENHVAEPTSAGGTTSPATNPQMISIQPTNTSATIVAFDTESLFLKTGSEFEPQ